MTNSDVKQCVLEAIFNNTLPPPTVTENGDGTYTYTWRFESKSIFGCPVEIDSSMPDNEIHLKSGSQVVKMKVTKCP